MLLMGVMMLLEWTQEWPEAVERRFIELLVSKDNNASWEQLD